MLLHTPRPQTEPPGQTVPHEPQLRGSLVVSAHAPLQLVCGAGHPQAPAPQVWSAAQARPQAPQLAGSICELMQRPPHT